MVATFAAFPVLSQAPPDAGRLLQETRPQERPPAPRLPPIAAPAAPKPATPAASGDARVTVTGFSFTGNGALSSETLTATVAPWAGRALTFGDLIEAVEAIEARYKAAGYFLAQAYLPPQKIKDGTIEIAISEGRLGETRLEGENRVAADVLYAYLDKLSKGDALTLSMLERQVLLINELAGGHASLDLQAGENPGSTDVVLAQTPDDLLSGRIEANNHGAPSTGVQRIGITLNGASPFNRGERISLMALGSANGGLTSYNLRGELPIGGDGWRVTATASRAEYSLGGSFANLQASGTADSIRLGAAYPFLRSRTTNLKVQVEADQSQLADKFETAGIKLDKQSHGFTATLSGDTLDEFMGGGSSRVDLIVRRGNLSLGDAAAKQDAPPTGLGTVGRFTKTTLNAQRQQTLTRDISLQLQMTWQMGNKNLDSSEKLALGGPTSIPGYAGGEASGDRGVQAKIAVRWQLLPELGLTAFTDYGKLTLARDPIAGTTKNSKRLTDLGLVADWMLTKRINANVIVAWAGREVPNPTDNDKPRLWATLGYSW